jgi:uncharacterized transporter YbjL
MLCNRHQHAGLVEDFLEPGFAALVVAMAVTVAVMAVMAALVVAGVVAALRWVGACGAIACGSGWGA